jgi:hypothetical protein
MSAVVVVQCQLKGRKSERPSSLLLLLLGLWNHLLLRLLLYCRQRRRRKKLQIAPLLLEDGSGSGSERWICLSAVLQIPEEVTPAGDGLQETGVGSGRSGSKL